MCSTHSSLSMYCKRWKAERERACEQGYDCNFMRTITLNTSSRLDPAVHMGVTLDHTMDQVLYTRTMWTYLLLNVDVSFSTYEQCYNFHHSISHCTHKSSKSMLTKSKVQGQFLLSVKYIGHADSLVLLYPFRHVCSKHFIPISYDCGVGSTLFWISRSAWFSISNWTISAWPCWVANISGEKSLWIEISWI